MLRPLRLRTQGSNTSARHGRPLLSQQAGSFTLQRVYKNTTAMVSGWWYRINQFSSFGVFNIFFSTFGTPRGPG